MATTVNSPKAVKIGDHICFYAEEQSGFLYGLQTGSPNCSAAIRPDQDRQDPHIPDPHVVCWKIVVGSRYKLQKNLTKLKEKLRKSGELSNRCKRQLKHAGEVYKAEERDNRAEQKKHSGSPVVYGQIIELYNVFTSSYLHASSTQPAETDKGHLRVELHPYHARHSQFKVMPKYKVRSEGDIVLVEDQIILESVKSPGQYLHVAANVFPKGRVHENCHEVNLSAVASGLTVYSSYSPSKVSNDADFLKGGDVIRLFHKEVEAYLCVEGSFGPKAEITSDVHFRVRPSNVNIPKTIFPSSSAIVYWQVEKVGAIYSGEPLLWIQQIRLRHPVTRHYLKVMSDECPTITEDKNDPYTVFQLHPITKNEPLIEKETFCRIEHVMTATWLHAKAEEFQSTFFKKKSMPPTHEFVWTTAQKKKVGVSRERLFADVFTIQPVPDETLANFRFVAGLIPTLTELVVMEDKEPGYWLRQEATLLPSLKELKKFMICDRVPSKKQQKFLRNLRLIDLLVELLRLSSMYEGETSDFIAEEVYDVLRVYCVGHSRKNELYLARHMDFFMSRLSDDGVQSLSATRMMIELIQDNIKIIERISHKQIRMFIKLLKMKKDHRYLRLLGTLCVCEGLALPENQRFITDVWLVQEVKSDSADTSGTSLNQRFTMSKKPNKCVYHTALGQAIGKDINILYVSKDNRKTWTSIFDMLDDAKHGGRSDIRFIEEQLELFQKLCYGNNTYAIDIITEELKHLTWEEAFCCLTDPNLPSDLRAKYCHLVEVLFMNTEDVHANLDHLKLTFLYHESTNVYRFLKPGGSEEKEAPSLMTQEEALLADSDVRRKVESIQNWLEKFLAKHTKMVFNQMEENILIGQVLSLVRQLVKLGYYGDSDRMHALLLPLIQLIDGRNDLPYDISQEAGLKSDELKTFQNELRYKRSRQADRVIAAKQCGLEILEMFLNLRFNKRLEGFVEGFKALHAHFYSTETEAERDRQNGIIVNFDTSGEPEETEEDVLIELFTKGPERAMADKERKEIALYTLNMLFEGTAFLKGFGMDVVLLDLCRYEYGGLVRKAISLLNRIFSAHDHLFSKAVQSQILLTEGSCEVFTNVVNMLPPLRRISMTRLEENQTDILDQFLDVLIGYCTLDDDPTSPHTINQRIIYNQGILNDLFVILTQTPNPDQDNFSGMKAIQMKTWQLVAALTRGNPVIQLQLYDRIEMLLNIKGNEPYMALALSEVFRGNKLTCMKITLPQVQMMMNLVAINLKRAPELLELLKSILKFEELDIPLRRNQEYIIKCFTQRRTEVADVLDKTPGERLGVLREGKGQATQYCTGLIDLLASCAERGSQFTESLCQSMLSPEELLDLLNDSQIQDHVKRPLLRFFHHVYFSSSDHEGQVILEYMADKRLWNYLLQIKSKFLSMKLYTDKWKSEVRELMKKDLSQVVWEEGVAPQTLESLLVEDGDSSHIRQETACLNGNSNELLTQHRSFYYVMDSVLPFLQSFYTCSFVRKGKRSKRESEVAHYLAKALQAYVDSIGPLLSRPEHQKLLITTHRALLSATRVPLHMMEALQSRSGLSRTGRYAKIINPRKIQGENEKRYQEYYKVEIEINAYFDTYAQSYQTLYRDENIVCAQLGLKCDREYMAAGSEEELPLSSEFQRLVSRFVNNDERNTALQFANAKMLINQLMLEGRSSTPAEMEYQTQEVLDVKCLQILRTMLHNEIVLVDPEEPLPISATTRKHLFKIREIQEVFLQAGVIEKVLIHMDSNSDVVVREVLAFLAAMLYEGNRKVQDCIYNYFRTTREEKFFVRVRQHLQQSGLGLKERKLLENQHESLIDETIHQVKKLKQLVRTGSLGKADFSNEVNSTVLRTSESLRAVELEMSLDDLNSSRNQSPVLGSISTIRGSHAYLGDTDGIATPRTGRKNPPPDLHSMTLGAVSYDWQDGEEMDENRLGHDLKRMVRGWLDDLPLKDESSLSLILKVIRLMCTGHNKKLQNYLHTQPDNFRSVCLVTEIMRLLQTVMSCRKYGQGDILVDIIHTLTELVEGNAVNKALIVDDRICDMIKEMMEDVISKKLPQASSYEKLSLYDALGNLISCLITSVAEDKKDDIPTLICQSIDQRRLAKVVEESFDLEQDKEGSAVVRKLARCVGFAFFHILNHIEDLLNDRSYSKNCLTGIREECSKHYETSTLSVEIQREESLHRIYFPCNYQSVLAKHVKEAFNYNVMREGPERINDYIQWSKEIEERVRYSRKLGSKRFTRAVVKADFWLNMLMMGLSFIAIAFMTAFWVGDATDLTSPFPVYRFPWARPLFISLAVLHSVVTFGVLVSYFIIHNPKLPDFINRKYRKWKDGESYQYNVVNYREPMTQHLRPRLISLWTLWFILLFSLSVGGIFVHHLYVFHLLHMANYVQLLKRAIKAITKNGLTLIMIYLFSLVFFTLFSLVNFAFYRDIFDGNVTGAYCDTFHECWITTHHRGLVIGLFEGLPPDEESERGFTWILHKATVDILFFVLITTIILNMVFGVILDTFAQLRDEKFTIDSQMLAHCFICGQDSYVFERKPGGFENHVKFEHNQWAYIFFFMYLEEKHKSTLTALEAYVRKKLEAQEYDFLPQDRAMVLEEQARNQSVTALQMLEARMEVLVDRVIVLENSLERQKVVEEQKEWLREYRKLAELTNYDVIAPTVLKTSSTRAVTFSNVPGTSHSKK